MPNKRDALAALVSRSRVPRCVDLRCPMTQATKRTYLIAEKANLEAWSRRCTKTASSSAWASRTG